MPTKPIEFVSTQDAIKFMDSANGICVNCNDCCCDSCARYHGWQSNDDPLWEQVKDLPFITYARSDAENQYRGIEANFGEAIYNLKHFGVDTVELQTLVIRLKEQYIIQYTKLYNSERDTLGWHPVYGFWDKERGCVLAREKRSYTCLNFRCDKLRKKLGVDGNDKWNAAVKYLTNQDGY